MDYSSLQPAPCAALPGPLTKPDVAPSSEPAPRCVRAGARQRASLTVQALSPLALTSAQIPRSPFNLPPQLAPALSSPHHHFSHTLAHLQSAHSPPSRAATRNAECQHTLYGRRGLQRSVCAEYCRQSLPVASSPAWRSVLAETTTLSNNSPPLLAHHDLIACATRHAQSPLQISTPSETLQSALGTALDLPASIRPPPHQSTLAAFSHH
jgi:hypothetical protein